MTLSDARKLYACILTLQRSDVARNPKFAYFLARNRRVLAAVEADFQEAIKDNTDRLILDAFETDRTELLGNLARKDENGSHMIIDGKYQFEDAAAVPAKLAELIATKHPDVQAASDRLTAVLTELGAREETLELYTLPIAGWPDLPADLDPSMLDTLYPLMSA